MNDCLSKENYNYVMLAIEQCEYRLSRIVQILKQEQNDEERNFQEILNKLICLKHSPFIDQE